MADLTVIRRDSFIEPYYLYEYEVVRSENDPIDPGTPLPLEGWEIRTTFRPVTESIENDPDDSGSTVAFTGVLIVDASGSVTTSEGLVLVGDAIDGHFALQLTSEETEALPVGIPLRSDVQFTFRNWRPGLDLVRTVIYTDTLTAREGYTNRLIEEE